MLKRIVLFTLFLFVTLSFLGSVSASEKITVKMNGVTQSFDRNPIIIKGTTLVPFRGILESLGASVEWNKTNQTITANKEGISIQLTVGQDIAKVNQLTVKMPQKVNIIQGRAMIPLRFISEHLNAKVDWEKSTKTVKITSTINVQPYTYPKLDSQYDVIVIGGDPEGVAAAVAAARNGAMTLLIEQKDGLGGLFTHGMLNQLDLGYDKDQRIANQGIFREWHQMVGGKGTFDIELGKAAFHSLVYREQNLTLLLSTKVKSIHVNETENNLVGITIVNQEGEHTIIGSRFIDATADADFAALAGVPYYIGQEDMGLKDTNMAVTLVMAFENVNWDGLRRAAEKNVFGGAKVYQDVAWGFADIKNAYNPIFNNVKLRGLNIGIQNNGIVTINALQIFDVDGSDEQSKQKAIEIGKQETENILEFLRANLTGFENATIAKYPSELYIRETRHVMAEYQLSIIDVWENRDQWDSIGLGAYPVDVQATSIDGYGYYVTKPIQYAIPFRSLVPLKVNNLLVASKASGYTSLAAGSARTVPIGMTVGQAAGTAAAISVYEQIDFREMSKDKNLITKLQTKLKEQETLIYPFQLSYPYQGQWFYPAIRDLLPLGVIQAGYNNDLKVNQAMPEREFLKLLSRILFQSNPKQYAKLNPVYDAWEVAMKTDFSIRLTRNRAAEILINQFGFEHDDVVLAGQVWKEAYNLGLIDHFIYERVQEDREITNAEGYYIIAFILNKLK